MNRNDRQDRAFPHDLSAERALLGGLLQDPDTLLRLDGFLAPQDFYSPQHGALFAGLQRMSRDGEPIDSVTVARRVVLPAPDRVGGVAYVAELPEHCPSLANLGHYAKIVRDMAARRALIGVAQDLVTRGFEGGVDVQAELESAVGSLSALAHEEKRSDDGTLADAIASAEQARADELARPPTDPGDVIATGFYELDQLLNGGLRPGDLCIIGGDPSMGKTSLAISIALSAIVHRVPTGFFLLEGTDLELAHRLQSAASLVPLARFKRPVLRGTGGMPNRSLFSADDEAQVERWNAHLSKLPLVWRNGPGAKTGAIAAQIRRWRTVLRTRLVVVDYLQLVTHERAERRDLEVGKTVKALKALALELGLAVVLLSQLSRREDPPEKTRKLDPKAPWWDQVPLPRMSHLRESGEIEQAADVILFPVRAERVGLKLDDPQEAVVVVAKNRNGACGVAPVRWHGATSSYRPSAWRSGSGS